MNNEVHDSQMNRVSVEWIALTSFFRQVVQPMFIKIDLNIRKRWSCYTVANEQVKFLRKRSPRLISQIIAV